MSTQTQETVVDRPIKRLIFGAIIGILFSAYVYAAIDRGVYLYFAPKDSLWNNIFWDDWLLRIIAIIISSGLGSITAGLIARHKGKIIGVISVLPSVLVWLFILYFLLNDELGLTIFKVNIIPESTSKLLILLSVLVNILVGYFGGGYGEKLSSNLHSNYDNRKYSLLGIKWYNFLWYPIVMYFILIEGFYITSYAYEIIKILFSLPEFSLSLILINFLSMPAFIGLFLIYLSVVGLYQILSDSSEYVSTMKGKVILSCLLIVVVPPVAFGLTYLSFYLESLFN
ncbi:MAG: hypothetical protein SCALA702_02200 [Melioribacteraceae bacterium]|nr:MAG: hypothetical protein SCALA702_02200 [Melioribacteraceae bacterium]